MTIAFITKGELDTRAITEVGLSAKPNTTTPIGMFGTGLKYTIATLVRMRIPFKLFIGTTEYEFYEKTEDFRGVPYHPLYMRKRKGLGKWYSVKLPFNTNYGKNWELWMVYRELHANTLDEGGEIVNLSEQDLAGRISASHTIIAVDGKDFNEVWLKRNDIFLPDAHYDVGLDETGKPALLEMWDKPSKYVYYRGLRVYTSSRPFLHTYNILSHLPLTEDRTAGFWNICFVLTEYFTSRCLNEMAILKVLHAEDTYAERTIDWDFGNADQPSDVYLNIVRRHRKVFSHLTGYSAVADKYLGPIEAPSPTCPDDIWGYIEEALDSHPEALTVLRELFGRTAGSPVPLPAEIDEMPF